MKREIANRIDAIASWRRERGVQDQFGFGPEVAARHARSAAGLDDLARFVMSLPDDDVRLTKIERLAFRGELFEPGSKMLEEIGRFRFHDADTDFDAFVAQMVDFAAIDRDEELEFGGAQVDGDNPWRADVTIRLPDPRNN